MKSLYHVIRKFDQQMGILFPLKHDALKKSFEKQMAYNLPCVEVAGVAI